MPTYEYRCPQGHDSEDFVLKISAAKSEIPCPVCGAPAPRRVSAGAGLVFKGSGFYITDYGKDGKKDQKPAAAAAAGDAKGTPTAASVPAAGASSTSGATASSPAASAKPKTESPKSAPTKSGPSTGSSSSGSQ